jgi:excisionase family DNA binding protein
METINFIQTTPTELANLIAQAVRQELKMLNRQVEKPSEPTKDLMTRKEVAKLFDISLVTIHEWCKSEILKPYKVGNRTYFKRVEVMEALSNPNQIIL